MEPPLNLPGRGDFSAVCVLTNSNVLFVRTQTMDDKKSKSVKLSPPYREDLGGADQANTSSASSTDIPPWDWSRMHSPSLMSSICGDSW